MPQIQIAPEDRMLRPGEVARALRVDPVTVTRWANAGKLRSGRTPGNHRRYWAADVEKLLGTPGNAA